MMETMVPWGKWVEIIEGYYPKGIEDGHLWARRSLWWMYLLQIWFNLSDEAIEDSLYDIQSMRQFVGINLLTVDVPDATTLLRFRHMLEEYRMFLLAPFLFMQFGTVSRLKAAT